MISSREKLGTRAPWDALERLRMGMAFEYDPRVVEALTRVLEKTGQLARATSEA
jgi:HD-GYP domain-containing protein (c-di-GMP phosphodiesterase class II)